MEKAALQGTAGTCYTISWIALRKEMDRSIESKERIFKQPLYMGNFKIPKSVDVLFLGAQTKVLRKLKHTTIPKL